LFSPDILAYPTRMPVCCCRCYYALLLLSGLEYGLHLIKKEKPGFPSSAVITGLIIGFVLGGGQHWSIYFGATLLAIVSKRFIRIQKRHIFNPAALGVFSAILILSATTQWQGTYRWHILLPAGLYFTYQIRKIELLLGYFLVALSLWGIQAWLQHVNVMSIFGYFSYFFIFIMLIEPRTTPVTYWGKILFGGVVALSIFLLTGMGVGFDVELCGLLIGNVTVPLLNRLKQKKKGA